MSFDLIGYSSWPQSLYAIDGHDSPQNPCHFPLKSSNIEQVCIVFFCLFSSTYSNSLNESDGKFSIFKTNSVWPVRAELLVHTEEEVRECHYFVALNCKFCSDLALVHLQFSYLCSIFRYGGLLSDNKQRRLGQAKVIQ